MATITLSGDVSGYVNVTVPTAAGANTVTFPAATGTVALLTGTTTAGQVFYGGTVSGTFGQSSNLFWDTTNLRLGIKTSTPAVSLAINATDAILVPVGDTGARPTAAAGYIRYNTDTSSFEGSNGSTWASVGGGATGGGSDTIFWNNGQTVTTSYSIPASTNAGTFGPVSIDTAATVTIPSTSTWTIV